MAIRADMDCLPMEEGSTLPYRSRNPGRSHSCGHDGHTASALGTALLLHRHRATLPSNCTVRFLFQVCTVIHTARVVLAVGALFRCMLVHT